MTDTTPAFRSHAATYDLLIREAKTVGQAIKYAIDFSGYNQEEIAGKLNISSAQLSLVISNARPLRSDLIIPFCKAVDNDLLIRWHTYKLNKPAIINNNKDYSELIERIEKLESDNKTILNMLSSMRITFDDT